MFLINAVKYCKTWSFIWVLHISILLFLTVWMEVLYSCSDYKGNLQPQGRTSDAVNIQQGNAKTTAQAPYKAEQWSMCESGLENTQREIFWVQNLLWAEAPLEGCQRISGEFLPALVRCSLSSLRALKKEKKNKSNTAILEARVHNKWLLGQTQWSLLCCQLQFACEKWIHLKLNKSF